MPKCCNLKNPLVRNGTSQSERFLKALAPSYIKIDENAIEDTLAFAHQYATLIKYYDRDNQSREDWQSFFEISDTVLLAIISVAPYKTVEDDINTLFNDYSDSPTPENVQAITDAVFQIASEIQNWNKKISPTHKLKPFILSEIEIQLQSPLITLAQMDQSIDPAVNDYSDFYTTDWHFDETTFNSLTSIVVNNVNDLKRVYKSFFQSYVMVILKAGKLFQSNLTHKDDHKPHITLFISFLYLFQYAKDNLNHLTKRHLDFYYKDVLHLEKNEQVPDKVHVIFELAKNYSQYALEKETTLKAGKDADVKALSYELPKEIVVNKATVDHLKTVYINPDENDKIYAAAKANSADAEGEAFDENSQGHWKPFGSSHNPEALVGIAIASPILFLKEGERIISLRLNLDAAITPSSLKNSFKIQVSTEESWLNVEEYRSTASEDHKKKQSGFDVEVLDNTLKFELQLHSGDPGLTPFNSEILAGGFDTAWPMVKIYLKEDSTPSAYGYLKDKKIQTINIDVDCKGVRDLIIQNDQTVFAPDKAFLPFGARPSIGSNFYIGSEETFSKALSSLSIVIEWLDLPPSGDFEKHYCVYNAILKENITNSSFKVRIAYLMNKIWTPLFKNEGKALFDVDVSAAGFKYIYFSLPGKNFINTDHLATEDTSTLIGENDAVYLNCKTNGTDGEKNEIDISISDLVLNTGDDKGIEAFDRHDGLLSLDSYSSKTQRGFIKLQLSGKDFQHTKYSEVYTKQALKLANKETDETTAIFPNEPYTPNIKSIYLDYTSSVEIDFTGGGVEQTFHLYPFGHKELSGNKVWALPQFTLDTTLCSGQLYIGLKDALPSQTLSLLFQVYEGSGDPEKEIPHINWLYLKDNQWESFADADIISDTTNGLVKSGIIKFLLPSDITSEHTTLLDKSSLWIKGSIKKSGEIDALPDLIDVRAQAAIVSFKDNNNSLRHLETALPAETISKLSQRTAAIKSLNQPYASFGGKTRESDHDFYRRISERLRHKNRAITIWDYERLVLQGFPYIHKVKCLNHTNMHTEIAPGFVMVVVIPDLRNKNGVNLLEPKVDVGTLEEIRDFLAKRNTPFVKGDESLSDLTVEKLKVVNPLYEQVKVNVKVKLNKDPEYYKKVLNDALKRFLAPWAYDEGGEISFGSKLHRSVVLNFIEEQEYVDFLTELTLEHYKGGAQQEGSKDEIQSTSARSILTSYGTLDPKTGIEHQISPIDECKEVG